jgi:hypothetical protein
MFCLSCQDLGKFGWPRPTVNSIKIVDRPDDLPFTIVHKMRRTEHAQSYPFHNRARARGPDMRLQIECASEDMVGMPPSLAVSTGTQAYIASGIRAHTCASCFTGGKVPLPVAMGTLLSALQDAGYRMSAADSLRALADQVEALDDIVLASGPAMEAPRQHEGVRDSPRATKHRDSTRHFERYRRSDNEVEHRTNQQFNECEEDRYCTASGSVPEHPLHWPRNTQYLTGGPGRAPEPPRTVARQEGSKGSSSVSALQQKLPQAVYAQRQQLRWLLKTRIRQVCFFHVLPHSGHRPHAPPNSCSRKAAPSTKPSPRSTSMTRRVQAYGRQTDGFMVEQHTQHLWVMYFSRQPIVVMKLVYSWNDTLSTSRWRLGSEDLCNTRCSCGTGRLCGKIVCCVHPVGECTFVVHTSSVSGMCWCWKSLRYTVHKVPTTWAPNLLVYTDTVKG